jgi:hypothetical protein
LRAGILTNSNTENIRYTGVISPVKAVVYGELHPHSLMPKNIKM